MPIFRFYRSPRKIVNVSESIQSPRILNMEGIGDAESAEESFILHSLANSTYDESDRGVLFDAIRQKHGVIDPADMSFFGVMRSQILARLRSQLAGVLRNTPSLRSRADFIMRRFDDTARYLDDMQAALVLVHVLRGLREQRLPAASARIGEII